MNPRTSLNLISAADDHRRARLLDLTELCFSGRERTLELRWPDRDHLQRAALNDLAPDGPTTVLSLASQLRGHSVLMAAGIGSVTIDQFGAVVAPIINRESIAAWTSSAADLATGDLLVTDADPIRLSAFITVSDQLSQQNPLLTGQYIERQLLSAIGNAIDKAALVGSGTNEPTGILVDTDVLTATRATAGVNTLADLAKAEKAICDAFGEAMPGDYRWVTDSATRATARAATGIGSPVWNDVGMIGYPAFASPHATANTVALMQTSAVNVVDWNTLQIENVLTREQSIAGFRTMLVSGFFNVVVTSPDGVCKLVDPA